MHLESRGLIALLTFGLIGSACGFPTVDYEDPVVACAMPMACANEVAACNNKAQAEQNMCAMKCSMTCLDCDADFERSLGICVAQCETCSANEGCANATASCKALLGVP